MMPMRKNFEVIQEFTSSKHKHRNKTKQDGDVLLVKNTEWRELIDHFKSTELQAQV